MGNIGCYYHAFHFIFVISYQPIRVDYVRIWSISVFTGIRMFFSKEEEHIDTEKHP
jgi:tellurite resistance protein TerC